MSRQGERSKKSSKVIPLVFNASLYYRKAVREMERFNFSKALKYFQRAVDLEPENPVNHCNVAGVLSEMGEYEKSNEILKYVLEKLDPHFYECYLYMANNYANMENYEMAEKYVLEYLRLEPDGAYVEEAEELLDFLCMELGKPPRLPVEPQRSKLLEDHDRARRLLEQGRFQEAAEQLQRLLAEHPDFVPARNNLSLIYFYMGQYDRAVEEAEAVLEKDPQNLHALCNRVIYAYHLGYEKQARQLMSGLKKVLPLQSDALYKLGVTLGVLGEHQTAYQYFLVLYHKHGLQTPAVVHHLAVAAFYLGDMNRVEYWLEKLRKMPEGQVLHQQLLRLMEQSAKAEPSLFQEASQRIWGEISRYRDRFSLAELEKMEQILRRVLERSGIDFRKVRKWEAIAAAVEYFVRKNRKGVSKTEVASRYGVSVQTLNKYLDFLCNEIDTEM